MIARIRRWLDRRCAEIEAARTPRWLDAQWRDRDEQDRSR